MPLQVFYDVGEYEMNHLFSANNNELNKVVLTEVMESGGERVDLAKFSELTDLYFYLPKKLPPNARNESENMWYVFSSNVHKGPTTKELNEQQGGPLKKILDLLWIKISEKFRSLAEAYRFFDVNFNNRVSFNEFQKALDHLHIKFQVA